MTTLPPKQEASRNAEVRQYSLAQILAVWAAAAIPMAVIAWVIAPLLGALLGGSDVAFIKALLLCITAGLIWQFVLTLLLTRREQGTLRWSRVRNALWLLSPRDPRSGRVGGRVWLWVIPFVLLYGLWSFFGFDISGPSNRDFGQFLDTTSGQEFFSGAWGWYAVLVVQQFPDVVERARTYASKLVAGAGVSGSSPLVGSTDDSTSFSVSGSSSDRFAYRALHRRRDPLQIGG